MPCTYYSPEEEKRMAREHVNRLTRMLCTACKNQEDGKTIFRDPELGKWWEDHQARDRQRAINNRASLLLQAENLRIQMAQVQQDIDRLGNP